MKMYFAQSNAKPRAKIVSHKQNELESKNYPDK